MAVLKGPRAEPVGPAKQLIVLCHGYGSNGDDLIALVPHWRGVLPDTAFVSPSAPEQVPGYPTGRQWFGLDGDERSPDVLFWGAKEAAPLLDAFLNQELERYGLEDSQMALVGFSQGTMMALFVGLRRLEAPAAILGYSGLLPDGGQLEKDILVKPPVMLVHGAADDRIPVEATHEAARVLEGLNVPVRTHVSQGVAHSIGQDGLELGGRFLADAFANGL